MKKYHIRPFSPVWWGGSVLAAMTAISITVGLYLLVSIGSITA